MKLFDLLRRRYLIVLAFAITGLACAIAYSTIKPAMYTATVRMFVATGSADILEAYQGNQAAQISVRTYANLVADRGLIQRAVNEAGVSVSVDEAIGATTAGVPPQTSLMDVQVSMANGEDAAKLARAVADQMIALVADLETPVAGGPPALRLLIVDPNGGVAEKKSGVDPIILGGGLVVGVILGVLLSLALDARSRSHRPASPSAHRAEAGGWGDA